MESVIISFNDMKLTNEYIVLSIDIGVCNLGISVSIVTDEFKLKEIIWIDLINITKYTHKVVKKEDCKLNHTSTFSDWLDHLYQEHNQFFEKADYILIERQPPAGFTVVEQLIFNRWRKKSYLISPQNVHSFLGINHLDYDKRKIASEKYARKYLNEDLDIHLEIFDRKHDISDSICMLMYWIDKKRKEYEKLEKIKYANSIKIGDENINDFLEKFRYKPSS